MSLSDRVFDDYAEPTNKDRLFPAVHGLDATRITKGLWMGSKPQTGSAVKRSGFDLLVLCAEEYQPKAKEFPGVEVIHAPFDDNDIGPLPHEEQIARKAAKRVGNALRSGLNVLVTCQQGRNRSGLVTGLALVENGHDPVQTLILIQERRPLALTNERFQDLLLGS